LFFMFLTKNSFLLIMKINLPENSLCNISFYPLGLFGVLSNIMVI